MNKDNYQNIKSFLIVIIVLLSINTILLILGRSDDKVNVSKNSDIKEEVPEYDTSQFKETDPSSFVKEINDGKVHFLYIGRVECPYCVQYVAVLNESLKSYNYLVEYIDMNKITEETYAILEKNGMEVQGTPTTFLFKDKKLVDKASGLMDIKALSKFLDKNGISKK